MASKYSAFATSSDLATFLGVAAPADAARLLLRASELIQDMCLNNIDLTNTDHVEVLKLAACAQVEFWLEYPESLSIVGGVKSFSSGDVQMDFGTNQKEQLAPRAKRYLNSECLLYRGVISGVNPTFESGEYI